MNMDLRSLKHVVVLSKLLSYTKAAQEFCLTQSALSRSIQSIERHANAHLFDRDRSGVHLTRVGRTFVERATALLREADELDRMLQPLDERRRGRSGFRHGTARRASAAAGRAAEDDARKTGLEHACDGAQRQHVVPSLVQEEIEFFICLKIRSRFRRR